MVDTSTPNVDATSLEGSVNVVHDMSITGMFWQADIIVQAVMITLFLASFWSWKIMADKWFYYKNVVQKAQKFEKGFWGSSDLDEWYTKIKRRANHPIAQIFIAGMGEWYASKGNSLDSLSYEAKAAIRERVMQIMDVARNREVEKMERSLNFLATVGSTAPFVGLFGTVWGIMNSFQNIAVQKSTNLVVVAPGIAEALFATAVGLLAAIPAVIAYNKLSGEVGRINGMLEDFTTEFDALLSRQFDSKK